VRGSATIATVARLHAAGAERTTSSMYRRR
jgi:hypothetical protein